MIDGFFQCYFCCMHKMINVFLFNAKIILHSMLVQFLWQFSCDNNLATVFKFMVFDGLLLFSVVFMFLSFGDILCIFIYMLFVSTNDTAIICTTTSKTPPSSWSPIRQQLHFLWKTFYVFVLLLFCFRLWFMNHFRLRFKWSEIN